MPKAITHGLRFDESIVYLAAYFSFTSGSVSGTSYSFHYRSVISYMIIAVSSSHFGAWQSAAMNMIFVFVGVAFIMKKAIAQH